MKAGSVSVSRWSRKLRIASTAAGEYTIRPWAASATGTASATSITSTSTSAESHARPPRRARSHTCTGQVE